MNVQIRIRNLHQALPPELIEAAGGDPLVARLFQNRGYRDPFVVRQMLEDSLYVPVVPGEFPGMAAAVEYIAEALRKQEKIAVYGDYDVDGVTSTALLVQCLRMLGGHVVYHVPDRFAEGYGMNRVVLAKLGAEEVKLVVTCDCGVSNVEEIAFARELGMTVLVTDHHTPPPVLPDAHVLLNPKLLEEGHRGRNLSGCGMAYFLAQALLAEYGMGSRAEDFLDLVSLSLIADVVSLHGENRYLLKKGMPRLFATSRIGLGALMTVADPEGNMESEQDIAFQLAPRINAAGRMDTARLPVDLLLCTDRGEALKMAEKIDNLNNERKRLQQQIIEEAMEQVETNKKNRAVLVLFQEYWHHGIIGIAAGKICETYRRPAVLLSLKEDGHTVVGSARSVDGINMYDLLSRCSKHLTKFGGHAKAAGLSLERRNLEAFAEELEREAEKLYYIRDTAVLEVDGELELEDIGEELYRRLLKAGPFGEGFEAPVFVSRHVAVLSDRRTERNHHFLVLAGKGEARVPAVKWFGEAQSLQDKSYDIAYTIGKNHYKGNTRLQLTLEELTEPAEGKGPVFGGDFLDCRGMQAPEVARRFPEAALFYEGPESKCPMKQASGRDSIRPSETLVLVSTPANTSILREVVTLVNPRKLILNFCVLPDYSFTGFLAGLAGILKYATTHQGGMIQLETLSMRLCVEDGIILAGMKYLQAAGKLGYLTNHQDGSLLVWRNEGAVGRGVFQLERNLKDALLEKSAYQQFLLKLEKDRFMEYLK